jgi:hypothetical protein
MALADIFPPHLVAGKFTKRVQVAQYALGDVDELARVEPATLIQIGLSIWHQVVTRKLAAVDAQAMAPHITAQDPLLYRRVEEHLAIKAISELHYLEMRVDDPAIEDAAVRHAMLGADLPQRYPAR